jgi:Cof subfamily protein (haloacid dehalogenase superfamily)
VTYKLLAVDLDGTLVRRDGVIHELDRAAIARLRRAGVPVTIATGRLYSGTRDVARTAAITGPIACVDGSHIVDSRDHTSLCSSVIAGDSALAVRRIIERHGAPSFLFAQDSIVHDELGQPFASYVSGWSPQISRVDKVTTHPYWEHEQGVHAVVCVGTREQIEGSRAELEESLPRAALILSFALERGGLYGMVVRAAGSTKGTAVAWIAAHYGCTPSEVVAVGDWLNDVPMFKVCGRSFAMAQAPKAVKEAATDQLKAHTNEGGGIAEAVARAWGDV